AMHVRFVMILLMICATSPALAQDKGSVDAKPLPPLAKPKDPKLPAKELFARRLLPSAGPAHVIGNYAKGCIGGAEQMPITGDTWQVMRLSRNRNWGYPDLSAMLKSLADKGA